MFLYCYLILAFGLFIVNADMNATYKCVDCRAAFRNCHIWETGYDVVEYHHHHQPEKTRQSVISDGTTANGLDTCIPEGYVINERDFDIACVWSPKLGCQMLLRRSHPDPSCMACLFDTHIRRYCPCQNTPSEERSGSGSERIYPIGYPLLQQLLSLFNRYLLRI